MRTEELYKVALTTVCSIAAILAIGLMLRGLYGGAVALIGLVTGNG